MKANEIKETARNTVVDMMKEVLFQEGNIKFAPASWAIPVTIEDKEVWVEVKLTVKQFTDTKRGPAFDPYEERAAWEEETRLKEEEKAAKAAAKKAKV